jgi:hypothetical protein
MSSKRLTTALIALTLGAIAACGPDSTRAPVAPMDAGVQPASAPSMVRSTKAKGKLNGLQWQKALKADVSASAVIGPEGGVLALPATGLRLVVPAGAVSRPTSFRATALAGRLVAYDFEPAGSTFPVPLRVEQDLSFLDLRHTDASALVAGYFPSRADLDQQLLTGRVAEVISTAPSTSAVTFPVWHFSGYVVGWGLTSDESGAY